MKSFSKIIITIVCVSLFMAVPIFAEEYVYKIPADRSTANTLTAASSSSVLGPYAASALQWVDSENAKAALTDNNGKGIVLTISGGPSAFLSMLSSAFSSQAIVYLFVDSSNKITNIGFIY